ncbi:MAG: galactokinase [Chloroflexi bacterium]|nr:galactokinase [Chloroflexota bacterium]
MRTARATAPGRVNLIGEHTDHNQGFALPVVIARHTTVTLAPRSDALLRLRTDAPGLLDRAVALDGSEPAHDWTDHVVGPVWALGRRGVTLDGFDCDVSSTVPLGAGLASSAALGIAMLRALRIAFALPMDDLELASVAHEAETGFVGARVGRMDQLVCGLGREGEALLIDFRGPTTRSVPIGGAPFELAVIDTGIRHDHATGGYNARRAECEAAAAALGVSSLRDLPVSADLRAIDGTLAKRVRHVVSENDRTLRAVEAIDRRDVAALGRLINASHASLRDDFAVSLPAIDALVSRLQADADVYGARLIGGGFGGSVLAITRPDRARAAAERATRDSELRASVVLPAV